MPNTEEKYQAAQAVIQEWLDQQGHDRCWYYPDLFRRLAVIFELSMTKDPALPPLDEFKKGCERYQGEEYFKGDSKT